MIIDLCRQRLLVVGVAVASALLATLFCTEPARATQIVTGAGASAPHVKRFAGMTGLETASFFAYGPSALQGVRVAAGDVNGDGTADLITSLGDGALSHVKAFSGSDLSEVRSFFAYGPSFSGGVYVASGDVNGDNFDDIVTGAGTGGSSHVKVFSGASGVELNSFLAFPGSSTEVRVAAGDVNGDGKADIVAGLGMGAGSQVKVFDAVSLMELHSFFAYGPAFTGGIYVAAGDINGDGLADIITGAGEGGSTHVKVFSGNGSGELASFFAYAGAGLSEVRVAAGDVNGDGRDDIITGIGPSATAGSHVKAFSGADFSLLQSYFAYGPSFTGGVYVAGTLAVPEPSTLLLASLATLLLITWRRK